MRTKGWKQIFSFTFIQFIKTKSFWVGTIVVCLILSILIGAVNILPSILNDEEDISPDGTDTSALTAVYLIDESNTLTAEDKALLKESGIALADTDKSPDALIETLKDSDKSEAMVRIIADEYEGKVLGYSVKTYYAPEADSSAVDNTTAAVQNMLNYRNLLNAGVTPETYEQSQRYIQTSKIKAGSGEWNMIESALNSIVPMIVSLLLFMMIFIYGSMVAQSIATEKTSRVMELLLTSVRPLAIVIGKVLAMGLVGFLQAAVIGAVSGITFAVTAPFGIGGQVIEIMQSPELQAIAGNAELAEAVTNTLSHWTPLSFILIFLCFILGFLFYALIAALVGASISRMEDLQQAMQPYSLLGVLGFYLAYFPVIFNMESLETGAATTNPVQLVSYYLPVSSPFALPGALLLGTISPLGGVIAVLILAAFVVLIAIVVSKVYEAIILHNGNRIKIGDIIKLATRK